MSQRDTSLETKEEVSVLQDVPGHRQLSTSLSVALAFQGLCVGNVTLTGVLQGWQLLASLVTMLSAKFTRTTQPDQQQQTICNKSLKALSF